MKKQIFTIALIAMFFSPLFWRGAGGEVFAQSPNYLWAKSAGGTSNDYGRSVATDASGNCFVCGWFMSSSITFGSYTLNNASAGKGDIFLAKFK